MRVPGLKTARRLGRWVRSRFRPSAIVLGYHRIAEPGIDLFEQCVSPRHFAEQLDVIRSIATPMPLADLVERASSSRLPERGIAITFDDAYADLLDAAVPLLREASVPATVFAVSGRLGREFWWDRLERALPSRRSILEDPELQGLHSRLRRLSPEEREEALLELEAEAGAAGEPGPRSVTADELRHLASDPLIEIGAHTRTHEWLPSLGAEARRQEIAGSREELEGILGAPVPGFAFPYGGESPVLAAEVREAGFGYACGSRNGVLFDREDIFMIPRWWVRNEDGASLSRRLGPWLRG